MADKSNDGDKSEKPTQKRLTDARNKGDVAKSKDVTATVGLLVWIIVLLFGAGFAGERIATLFEDGFTMVATDQPFEIAAPSLGWAAFLTLLMLTGIALIPPAIAGTLTEFLQAGSIFTTEKLKPSLDKMNPFEGLKRMFGLDNWVELAKTIVKAALILFVSWLVLRGSIADILGNLGPNLVPTGPGSGRAEALAVLGMTGKLTGLLLGWTLAVFLLVAVIDAAWQRHSYIKKLKMSIRDIRQEMKQSEGDPMMKSNRRQLHQEWANQNAVGAARGANVLVVNPTHIAIALDYDAESCPIPVIAGKGEGPLAQAMRQAAEEAGVPIIRNVEVARTLFEHGAVDEIIPRDMFDAIAEIILWAGRAREAMAKGAAPANDTTEAQGG